jgi:hypothetical protein
LANRRRFAKHSPANGRRASGTKRTTVRRRPAIEGMAVLPPVHIVHGLFCPCGQQNNSDSRPVR